MKKLLALLLVCLLAACQTTKEIHYVSSPPPRVSLPAEPRWLVDEPMDKLTDGQVAQRWVAFKVQALCYIHEMKLAVEPLTNIKPGDVPDYCKPKQMEK